MDVFIYGQFLDKKNKTKKTQFKKKKFESIKGLMKLTNLAKGWGYQGGKNTGIDLQSMSIILFLFVLNNAVVCAIVLSVDLDDEYLPRALRGFRENLCL